jgi:outer membrane receptor protein involved in Fe transport
LNEKQNSSNKQKGTNLNINLTLNAHITDFLKASIIGSFQSSGTDQEQWWGEKTNHVAILRQSNYGVAPVSGDDSTSSLPFGGELTTNHIRNNTYMLRTQVDFNKYLGQTNTHLISASVGFELNSTKYNGFLSINRGYYKERGRQFSSTSFSDYPAYSAWMETNYPTITDNLTNLISGYATLSYSYKNFFTLNANARIDGSNKFGDRGNEKLLPIWSVSGNYNISEHPFLKRDWIDFIMLKLSYGYQGNMLEGQSPQMIIHQSPMDPLYNELVSELSVYPNPNLRWEKTNSFNAGLEFSLFHHRLQFEGSAYYKKTQDAFLNKDISSVNGVEEYVVNSGSITNYGYSVAITAEPLRLKDFNWILSTSFSKVFNKLNTQPGQEQYELNNFLNGTALINGQPVGTFFSYKFLGLSPNDGQPIFDTMEDRQDELVSLSKYDFYTSILDRSGSREPTISGSINNTFRYKEWRLNMLLNYSLGSKIRLMRLYGDSFDPVVNVSREFLNHWKKPGDEKTTNIPFPTNGSFPWSTGSGNFPAVGTNTWTMYNYGNQRVASGDYLKLATLSLTYEFPIRMISKLHLSRLALSMTGNNLYTMCSSRLKGQTPQQSGFSDVQLTDQPSFTFGLDVSF